MDGGANGVGGWVGGCAVGWDVWSGVEWRGRGEGSVICSRCCIFF